MTTLSARQKNILEFIISFFRENKFPPTIREIGEKVGISSTSVVNYNLAKLVDENLLIRHKEVSRGLSVNWDRLTELGIVDREQGNGEGGHRVRVPILGHIAAGEPIRVEPRDTVNPEDWIDLAGSLLGSNNELFALRVRGNSMIDASVLDGDIVILRHQRTANDGDMVAAWIEGDEETTLKYLYREGKNVRLQPANPNPEYRPIIRPANKVQINGKVVSVIRVLNH
ncbi:MAG: transcriptional repressor LexA [Caldilineaceae bacterium]